ncbi:MAG TPA: hypothetical protein VIW28_11560 [Gemmatimonadales bacterium]|jgi:hypothetical protein
MTNDRDRALHELFGALQKEAAAGAPKFHDALTGAARRRERIRRARRRVAGITAVVAATALVLMVVAWPITGGKRADFVDLATTRWEAPTDFLLRTPGAELLRAVPTFTTGGRIHL